MLEVGTLAPDFELVDENGVVRRLSEYRGQPVVLYFYPKDDTPGCTVEACNFRDDYSAYEKAGVVILGVSPDAPKVHEKFKEKYGLPFTLLSDPTKEMLKQYGVWGPKKFMGRTFEGVLRTTYLIDAGGKILQVYQNVRPPEHSRQILKDLAETHTHAS